MNENISWGKIVVLVVAMLGVGVLGFVVGRKNDEAITVPTTIVSQPKQEKVTPSVSKDETMGAILAQTYKNEQFGFSIQYPEAFDVVVQNNDSSFFEILFTPKDELIVAKKMKGFDRNPLLALKHYMIFTVSKGPYQAAVSNEEFKKNIIDSNSGSFHGQELSVAIEDSKQIMTASGVEANIASYRILDAKQPSKDPWRVSQAQWDDGKNLLFTLYDSGSTLSSEQIEQMIGSFSITNVKSK
jgi:hypothetical protein